MWLPSIRRLLDVPRRMVVRYPLTVGLSRRQLVPSSNVWRSLRCGPRAITNHYPVVPDCLGVRGWQIHPVTGQAVFTVVWTWITAAATPGWVVSANGNCCCLCRHQVTTATWWWSITQSATPNPLCPILPRFGSWARRSARALPWVLWVLPDWQIDLWPFITLRFGQTHG